MANMLSKLDLSVARFANRMKNSIGKVLSPICKVITLSGDGGIAFIAVSLLLVFFRSTRQAGVVSLLAMAIGTIIANAIIKPLVARQRPFRTTTSLFYKFWMDAGVFPAGGYSFPSGHTTAAMSFAAALFLCLPGGAAGLLFLIPIVMGFTRIYFGVHYATDVLAGMLLGLFCTLLGMLIFNRLLLWDDFSSWISMEGTGIPLPRR